LIIPLYIYNFLRKTKKSHEKRNGNAVAHSLGKIANPCIPQRIYMGASCKEDAPSFVVPYVRRKDFSFTG
jgi:hypothetical protein